MDKNEGLFGIVNYQNTPLEVKSDNTFGIAMLKGSGRAVIDCSILFGGFCLIASGIDFIKFINK